MTGKQSSAMDKAQKAIESGKLDAQKAAVKFGLSVISIYRKPWYKAWRAQQEAGNA
jgi:hypothetical protein